MSKVKGTVSGAGKGKFSYFITLEEREGFYFNTKYEPKCGVGDVVGIEFIKKADNRGNVQKVKIIESNSDGYPGDGGSEPKSGGSSYTASPGIQDSIMWQSSRKDALVFVGMLLSNDGFATKGKPDAKRVQIEELLDEVTTRFFGDASDPKASSAYTSNVELTKDEEPDEPEEEKDEWDDEWDD